METFKSQNELKQGFKRKESVEMNTHWNRNF